MKVTNEVLLERIEAIHDSLEDCKKELKCFNDWKFNHESRVAVMEAKVHDHDIIIKDFQAKIIGVVSGIALVLSAIGTFVFGKIFK